MIIIMITTTTTTTIAINVIIIVSLQRLYEQNEIQWKENEGWCNKAIRWYTMINMFREFTSS